MQMRMEKRGLEHTYSHSHYNLLGLFFFCIDSKACAQENGESIAESNRRSSYLFFLSLFLALPFFFYLIFER